jgi:hypothetical protein
MRDSALRRIAQLVRSSQPAVMAVTLVAGGAPSKRVRVTAITATCDARHRFRVFTSNMLLNGQRLATSAAILVRLIDKELNGAW